MKNNIPSFEEIFSFENLYKSFKEFEKGKKYKPDVAEFKSRLVENLSSIHFDMLSQKYKHNGYFHFKISDPKPRDIHKASVRDRIVHHALYLALYPHFDPKFIFDSYSCRLNKGTHKAIRKFEYITRAESCNYTKTIWVLKCDIRKCFASVDKEVLKSILRRHIICPKTMSVICSVIDSFDLFGKGIPLGNLTSQLFINIYLNEFDQWMKREVKVKKYIRYADDFVIISTDKKELEMLLPRMQDFLEKELKFQMHPNKVFIQKIHSGVDFLGWVHFPKHRVLRTKTKKRMFKNILTNPIKSVIFSYLGLLSHGNTYKLQKKVHSMVEYTHE